MTGSIQKREALERALRGVEENNIPFFTPFFVEPAIPEVAINPGRIHYSRKLLYFFLIGLYSAYSLLAGSLVASNVSRDLFPSAFRKNTCEDYSFKEICGYPSFIQSEKIVLYLTNMLFMCCIASGLLYGGSLIGMTEFYRKNSHSSKISLFFVLFITALLLFGPIFNYYISDFFSTAITEKNLDSMGCYSTHTQPLCFQISDQTSHCKNLLYKFIFQKMTQFFLVPTFILNAFFFICMAKSKVAENLDENEEVLLFGLP